MRLSRLFGRTLREDPADADTPSHRLLLRAGLIDQVAAGLYTMLPLGLRVQRKIEQIIREEITAAGGQEVLMPVLQPLELWQQSGRDVEWGDALFRLQDRRERPLVLGPTHEEVITPLAGTFARSYRDLPVTPFQIQTKMRDEVRPRAGLLRVREFVMMDAYSFDADEAGMDASFEAMRTAYQRIFDRCGLPVILVEADSGAIGGKESLEVVLPVETGEDTVVRCPNPACGYAANTEKAAFRRVPFDGVAADPLPLEEVSTPGIKTIETLADFLGISPAQTLKAVFYRAETAGQGVLVFAAIRGDVAVIEVKLKHLLKCEALRLAADQEVAAAGLVAGSASPVGISPKSEVPSPKSRSPDVGLGTSDLGLLQVVADLSVPEARNVVAGGNRPDVHLRNVNYGRDFVADVVADIGTARGGDPCARCGAPLSLARAIEVGHIFKLGLRYSEVMGARFLDRDGRQQPMWMGCYGIGVGRMVAAAVEIGHDDQGIVWPPALAPYHVHLLALNVDNPEVATAAGHLYDELQAKGVDVLYDDRPESPGVKFNDADLLGLPLRATVGPRGLRQGEIELRWRATGETQTIPLGGAAQRIAVEVEQVPSVTAAGA
ncbi:MAG: proline--tRNA ligase [Chloroflexota bacterium]